MTQRIQSITGYPLDKTQQRALQLIEDQYDVLATLPTGSGKTVIALTAIILNAFDKGHRAILTTPVKALSNQKYAEFQTWLTGIGFPNRITLLTGDIQERATAPGGDGGPELLIMTSEILANKLRNDPTRSDIDPDLANVSVLVIDEAHYINDTERGHVWERTIMFLPPTIQIVALSATLSEPERFQEWLSRRRPTQLVQRHDRHVPLHFGFYDATGFKELYNTKQEHKIMDSTVYKKLTPNKGTFAQAITKIVKILEKDQKLPSIIFLMSKAKCEEAAYCLGQNLLYGHPPVMGKDDDPLAFGEIQSEHQYNVTTIRNRQDALFNKYIRPYDTIPGLEAFKNLIDKGIAYHHAGMIPILREYVEILFSEKLLKVVFATETLAIGINMPAKSVVFTSLEKPSRGDDMVPLRPEQFMQMGGRAGRRGMDDKGHVIYYPIKDCVSDSEFRHLLFGKMPSAVSQLSVDPLFVLKNVDENVLERTLLHHQQERYILSLTAELAKIPVADDIEKLDVYLAIRSKLEPGTMIRLSNSQRKGYEREIADLKLDDDVVKHAVKRRAMEKEIQNAKTMIQTQWAQSLEWLKEYEFISDTNISNISNTLTLAGKVASGLSDGLPLVRGAMIANNILFNATFEEFAGWLGCFTEPLRVSSPLEIANNVFNQIMNEIEQNCDYYKASDAPTNNQYNTGQLMYLWATNKDINEICQYIGTGQIGTFIKAVLRVISYTDELKKVLLGLQHYEMYNRLDGHQDRLLGGIITNRSLYL